jgi:threonine dehydratase
VTIVAPHGNSADKNESMRGWGAELIEHGHDFQAARECATSLAEERGHEMIPSYHDDLVLGVATYGLELFTAVTGLDAVYVPVGMGSGICALIIVRDLLGLDTEIVGVVAADAPANGTVVHGGPCGVDESAATFIDGVACRVRTRPRSRSSVAARRGIVEVSGGAVRRRGAAAVLHHSQRRGGRRERSRPRR